MQERNDEYHARRPASSRQRAPVLMVRITSPVVVRIVAADLLEQRDAEPFAELVAHVLEHALAGQAGTA